MKWDLGAYFPFEGSNSGQQRLLYKHIHINAHRSQFLYKAGPSVNIILFHASVEYVGSIQKPYRVFYYQCLALQKLIFIEKVFHKRLGEHISSQCRILCKIGHNVVLFIKTHLVRAEKYKSKQVCKTQSAHTFKEQQNAVGNNYNFKVLQRFFEI